MCGWFIVFKVQQFQIRHEVKTRIAAGLPDSDLVQIVVNAQNAGQLEWEHDREFQYQGRMYDVVRSKKLDRETVVHYCIPDDDEDSLMARLDDLVNKVMETEEEEGQKRPETFKITSICLSQNMAIYFVINRVSVTYSITGIRPYSPPFRFIPSPPPEVV